MIHHPPACACKCSLAAAAVQYHVPSFFSDRNRWWWWWVRLKVGMVEAKTEVCVTPARSRRLEACSAPPRPVLENVRAHFGGAARSCLHAFCMLRRLCLERHKVEGVDRIRCEHGWLSVRGKSGRVFLRPMLAGVVARTKSAGETSSLPARRERRRRVSCVLCYVRYAQLTEAISLYQCSSG